VILRLVVRDLRRLGVRAVLVVVAVALAAGTGAGALLAKDNVLAAREGFYKKYRLADLEMSLKSPVASAGLLARARSVGATHAEVRLVVPGEIHTKEGNVAAYFVGMPPQPELDRLQLLQGRGLAQLGKEGVVVEQDFARVHRIKLGQRLKVTTFGFPFELTVQGIGRTPDSLYATADPQYFIIQRGSLAYLFLPLARVQQTAEAVGGVRPDSADDLLLDLPGRNEHVQTAELAHDEPVNSIVPRNEQFGYRITQTDLAELDGFIPTLTIILSAVAALLIFVTIMRLVQSRRRQLGTMLALGHSRLTVVLATALPPVMLGAGGGLLAVPASVWIAKLMTDQYSVSHGFLAVPVRLAPWPAALAFGLAVATTVIAAVLPAIRLARLLPTEALRGDAPDSAKLPRWTRPATSFAGAGAAYAVRSVVRTPMRSVLTVIGLAGAIGLGISLHVAATSVTASTNKWFERQAWTHTIILQEPTAESAALNIARRAGASSAEPIVSGSVQLATHARRLGLVNVVGVPSGRSLQDIGLPRGGIRDHTVYPSTQVMRQFGLRDGQHLILRGSHGTLETTVKSSASTLAEQDCYLPLPEAQMLLGLTGKTTSVLIVGGRSTSDSLKSSAAVAQTVTKTSIEHGLDEILSQLTLLMNAVVSISLAVGAFFLVSSLIISVLERQHEFALLRALGWRMTDITSVILCECAVFVGFGSVLGALAAPWIASPIIGRLSAVWFPLGYDLRATNFLLVIGPALALTPFVATYIAVWISRLDIGRTVRARMSG
jgi:putative ABC transport system permease protein